MSFVQGHGQTPCQVCRYVRRLRCQREAYSIPSVTTAAAVSDDGGKTWETNWVAAFTRAT